MLLKVFGAILAVLLLTACQPLPGTTPTPAARASHETAIQPSPWASATVLPSVYKDTWLCFAVEVPEGWFTDGVPGGFASFAPPARQASFRITQVALEELTLERALNEVRRGPLGAHIQEIAETFVDNHPALWITFQPNAEFSFVVLAIAPDCGDGPHALFISMAGAADRESFEAFLNSIRFISPEDTTGVR
ncbi:MAG: hypothetical protein RML46_11525 [Anaerolineae bacterium]|nr:hypothetical protein [Anaerolineae bacterium]